jgi:hypothetical protein
LAQKFNFFAVGLDFDGRLAPTIPRRLQVHARAPGRRHPI